MSKNKLPTSINFFSWKKLSRFFRNSLIMIMFIAGIIILPLTVSRIQAQSELTSDNYKIIDPTIDSGGGAGDSASGNYSLLTSLGNPTADARLTSGTYALGSGFPSGIQANVPLITCVETDTIDSTSQCANFPNTYGAQGECGAPGCYDRAKIEINHQDNPIDTLFLVRLYDTTNSTTYYLQSDHSIAASYDIADYMTICAIEGMDSRDTSCDDAGDANWNQDLQSMNILGLQPNHTYQVSVRALHGDFTESQYSPTTNISTALPTVNFDIDTGTNSTVENDSPYHIELGFLSAGSVQTASDRIWLDINTNAVSGQNTFVRDLNQGLSSGAATIPSEAEDLAVDPNNNGGFGLKTSTVSETRLGPLISSVNYSTGSADEVGNLITTNRLIFSSNSSGGNKGQLVGGRAGIYVKGLSQINTPTGSYTDTITFSVIGNY